MPFQFPHLNKEKDDEVADLFSQIRRSETVNV